MASGNPAERPTRVIAWGTPTGLPGRQEAMYAGNALCATPSGSLIQSQINGIACGAGPPQRLGTPFTFDGHGIGEPHTYERVVAALEKRAGESPAEWLVSGAGVALVEVDSMRGRDAAVHLVSWVCGEPGRVPRIVRVSPRHGLVTLLWTRERFVLPTTAATPDTLVAPVQISDNCCIRGSSVLVLGISPQELDKAVWHDATGLHLRRVRSAKDGH